MTKLYRFILSFLILCAVDPDQSGVLSGATITDGEPNDGKEPELSTEDLVAAEFGFDKDDPNAKVSETVAEVVDDADADTAKDKETEAKPEPLSAEDQIKKDAADATAAEEAKKGITEDDLKPLDSKNKDTNARFTKVTEGYKAEVAKVEKLTSDLVRYEESIEGLRQLGFTDANAASDLVEFSAFRHTLATGDVDKFRAIIEQQVQQFEALHGKKVAISGSALDEYPELKAKVESLDLSEDDALEIVKGRKITERANREVQQRQQSQQSNEQIEAVREEAFTNIATMQANWKKTDPDYEAVMDELLPEMATIAKNFPPAQWASIIERDYKQIKKLLVQGAAKQTTDPLRGNARMTSKTAPTSVEEAVLAEMGFDLE